MQMMIEIDEDIFTRLFDNGVETNDDLFAIAKSIRNGKPLPKGHGRLIDADIIFTKLNERIHVVDVMMAEHEPYRNNEIPLWMWDALIEDITILEADKEDE